MGRRHALGLALLLALGVLLVGWWTSQEKRALEHDAPGPLRADSAVSSEPELLAPDPTLDADERSEVPASSASEPPRRTAPKDWPRITGRVVLPSRIPDGEDVRVEAIVTLGRRNRVLDTPVASDGAFTLAVPKEATYAELDLVSRFLRMQRSVGARPGQKDVRLEPTVFALVEGEILLPLGRSGPSGLDFMVSWSVDGKTGRQSGSPPQAFRGDVVVPDDNERFALEFLPVGVAIELVVENPFGPPARLQLEPLTPCEKRRLEVPLEEGITISGRVVDENGDGVAGVTVVPDQPGGPIRSLTRDRLDESMTDAEGRFALRQVSRDVTRVSTRYAADLARGGHATIDCRGGDVHDVLIEILRGACIEGTVEWPDGSAAQRFLVTASGPDSFGRDDAVGGSFRMCRLTDGPHVVEVHATRADVAGSARVMDVRPGAAPLRIVLEEASAFELHGTVVNAHGDPIGADIEAASPGTTRRARATTFHDGSFVLSGLEEGEWRIEASARGHQTGSERVRVGPGAAPSLRFVLGDSGRIRGTVVDGAGAPLRGARIQGDEVIWTPKTDVAPENATDDKGRFEVEVSATRVSLFATKEGFAPSSSVELAVDPGATVEDVVLVLRASCRVTGRVLDEQGHPLSRARVHPARDWRAGASETDARGVFELADLPPGTMTLVAMHPQLDDATASAEVVLVAGRDSSVELRFERRDPVRVHGRITRGGQALAVDVFFQSRGFEARAVSGPDGRIEVELQRPGNWSGRMAPQSERECLQALDDLAGLSQCDLRSFELLVPDADELAFELDFDTLKRVTSLDELGY